MKTISIRKDTTNRFHIVEAVPFVKGKWCVRCIRSIGDFLEYLGLETKPGESVTFKIGKG